MAVQPVDLIDLSGATPSPSLLTSARDRTSDGFGAGGPEQTDTLHGSRLRHRWIDGIAWNNVQCQWSYLVELCGGDDRVDPDLMAGPVATKPFKLYTPLACSWVSTVASEERLQGAAEELTTLHTAYGLSRALWLGEGLPETVVASDDELHVPTLRYCAQDVSLGGPGVPGDLDDVVAVLLQAYEDCTGGLGGAVLHVPTVAIPGALGGIPGGGRVAWPEGNFYRGPSGSVVSPGPGYPHGASLAGADGFGPLTADGPPALYQGNADDEVWVYVTGPIEYALSDVTAVPADGLERRNFGLPNTYDVWGERDAIVRFDCCCVFGALAHGTAGPVS